MTLLSTIFPNIEHRPIGPDEGGPMLPAKIACVANNGTNGEPEVPLWDCPCPDCTRMDWELAKSFDEPPAGRLGDWRRERFPEFWGRRN